MNKRRKRTVAVITTSRADYGIYRPVLEKMRSEQDIELRLVAGGTHLSADYGMTIDEIIDDGYSAVNRAECCPISDTSLDIAEAAGKGVENFSRALWAIAPDIIMTLGDRLEMMSAVIAALPLQIPVAHIHGGEITEGAVDDNIRHAMTKMSHLHFTSTADYAKRIIQMGEEPWRVTVSGAPSLDNLKTINWMSLSELERCIGTELNKRPLLVTYHPETHERNSTKCQIEELLSSLSDINQPIVFTHPNSDSESTVIVNALENFTASHKNASFIKSLGSTAYFSLMKYASAMVGNSSSGIIEAASLALPVVNIGDRQKGRMRASNVIDCECREISIIEAINRARSSAFRNSVSDLKNPYGSGCASEVIVDVLMKSDLSDQLLRKKFIDIEPTRYRKAG